jgi:hypothetical protein
MSKDRNVKYKQVQRIQIFGDDNINTNSSFQYALNSTNNIINAVRFRFTLNNALNDVKLSQNARCVVETCNIPTIQNMGNKYVIIRLVTATNDKTCDTKKFLAGNPILLTMAMANTLGTNNILYNASEFFYNINIPPNLLSLGYIDVEIEVPNQNSASIDFLTSSPLASFFINLVIIDEDPQLTTDTTLAPPIDYKNYHNNMPIRPY